MRRVARTALHKHSNHSRVKAYSTRLGQIFDDWLSTVDSKGYSASALINRLDLAAVQWFPQAFANGRHQAYPKQRPSADGQQVLTAKLLSNRHYLQNSLQPDIDARAVKWKLQGEPQSLSDALSASFRSRVVDMYGGAIWTVTEAGYRAGVGQARTDLAIRITGRIHAEADDGEDQPQPGDAELAIALGLTLGGLLLLLAAGRSAAGIFRPTQTPETGLSGPTTGGELAQLVEAPGVLDATGVSVMLDYEDEGDDAVCDPCASNAAGSPYTEAECPIPGEDCSGMNNCRCMLNTVVDDSALAQAA
jgi:hypothetical protein